jgi:hypothetical protein
MDFVAMIVLLRLTPNKNAEALLELAAYSG